MPIFKVPGGFRWGTHGHVYKSITGAARQAAAAYAHGYRHLGDAPDGPVCALPSSGSACDLIRGVPGAFPRVVVHTMGRACLIAAGLYFLGGIRGREARRLPRLSLGAAVAIEIFALAWSAHQLSAPVEPSV